MCKMYTPTLNIPDRASWLTMHAGDRPPALFVFEQKRGYPLRASDAALANE